MCADDIPLSDIAAYVGTPCYTYSWSDIEARYQELNRAIRSVDARIRYAVKANSNIEVLRRMVAIGAGFDIVSGGELERVIRAGGSPSDVVFSGVGKSHQEISFGLKAGIRCFNVESKAEMFRIAEIAERLAITARVAIRVNPDIDVDTHPYIATGMRENKFGMPENDAFQLAVEIANDMPNLEFVGLACHIGSQLTEIEPYADSLDALVELRSRLRKSGITCEVIDIGGGFGITYSDEVPFSFADLGELISQRPLQNIEVDVEPGRSLIGSAGVLLTRVEYLKPATRAGYLDFCIVDAAMNDLIRPALYDAFHDVEKVIDTDGEARDWNIVGPICETGDFLATARPLSLREGDLLAIRDVGAYGFVMSSNYNSRLRPAEVVVEGDSWVVSRRRESINDMLNLEEE